MIDKILKFTDDYSLYGKTVIIAFSGGFDSMCLLDIFYNISAIKNIRLVAAHYNHNWRGAESKNEQIRCEEFCKERGIEFYTETAPPNSKKTETCARDLRYDFLSRTAKKYNTDIVLTAHNYDDNAETILYRIIKGTGVVGIKGIAKVRGIYYRPLLDITRTEIEKYCSNNNLSPNKDSSNNNVKYNRNLIRHKILPLLESINPEIKKSLNSLSNIASSELSIIEEYLESLSKKLYNGGKIVTTEYSKLSGALKRKIIYNLLYNFGIEYDYSKIVNVCDFIETQIYIEKSSKTSLTDNIWLYVGKNYIEIVRAENINNTEIIIEKEGKYKIANAVFCIEKCAQRKNVKDESVAYVKLEGKTPLTLRTRRDGDIIYPLGLGGKMKLKKYLNNKKIPQHKRNNLVLLCQNNEVLWVGGVGMSDKIKTTEKPTHKISIKYNED